MMEGYAIGIDLGSVFTRSAVWRNGSVDVIVDDQGHRKIPSYVSFHGHDIVVGNEALNLEVRNPTNTIFEGKQFIGRHFNDPRVQTDLARWPFKVVEDSMGRPVVEVTFEGVTRTFSAEDVAWYILREVKEAAEDFLNDEVTSAVVAVPATFTYSQRHATLCAAKRAGLHVLRTLSAVDAAALTYGLKLGKEIKDRTVVIFDFGGGSLDLATVVYDEGVCEVRAVTGDSHLGGVHFDQLLVEHCLMEFRRRHGADLCGKAHPRALRRLYAACESAKRSLSKHHQAYIDLDSLLPGQDLNLVITRAFFNDLCMPVFTRCVHLMERLLMDAKLSAEQVHDLVLVGGSSRIPKLREMLFDVLGGRQPDHLIDPDESIVQGAALQAAIQTLGDLSSGLGDMLLLEVTPLSLGVEIQGGLVAKVVKRNTTLPAKKMLTFTTTEDNQTVASIRVFQGEHNKVEEDHCLGEFRVEGMPAAVKGGALIDVTFDLDANGLLHVTAEEREGGAQAEMEIAGDVLPTSVQPQTVGVIDLVSGYAHKHHIEA